MQDDVAYDYEGRLYNFGQIKANYTLFSGFMALKNFFKTENFDIIFDIVFVIFGLKNSFYLNSFSQISKLFTVYIILKYGCISRNFQFLFYQN